MRDTIDMAREAGWDDHHAKFDTRLDRLVALVRADERNSWPAEMEAMERQVNILTDALAAEREACAQVVVDYPHWLGMTAKAEIANAIRARGENT